MANTFEIRKTSNLHLFGLPLYDIAIGGAHRQHARGIVAIGQVATGVIAIGPVAMGLVAIGACVEHFFRLYVHKYRIRAPQGRPLSRSLGAAPGCVQLREH